MRERMSKKVTYVPCMKRCHAKNYVVDLVCIIVLELKDGFEILPYILYGGRDCWLSQNCITLYNM